MWIVWDVGYSRCGMFGICGCWMFRMWDVWDVGSLEFGMWDVGCGMFAGMWDVDLQKAFLDSGSETKYFLSYATLFVEVASSKYYR